MTWLGFQLVTLIDCLFWFCCLSPLHYAIICLPYKTMISGKGLNGLIGSGDWCDPVYWSDSMPDNDLGWLDCLAWLVFSIGFRFDSIGDDWRALINWAEWIGFIGCIRLAWGELVLDGLICFIGVIGLYWTGSAWLVDFIPWLSLDWFDWLIGLLGLLWLFYEEEESNAKWKTQIESNGNHGAARAASRGVRKVAFWKCGRAKKNARFHPPGTPGLCARMTRTSREVVTIFHRCSRDANRAALGSFCRATRKSRRGGDLPRHAQSRKIVAILPRQAPSWEGQASVSADGRWLCLII